MPLKILNFSETVDSPGLVQQWVQLNGEEKSGNFFQSPHYLALFHGCPGYRPIALFALEGEKLAGFLVAVAIRQRISGIPFQRVVVIGGPVVSEALKNSVEITRELLIALKNCIPADTVFVEIRNTALRAGEAGIFTDQGYEWNDHLNSLLPVESQDALFAGLKSSKQRQIKRGLENGAIMRIASSIEDVTALYGLLKLLYKKRVRKPLPPLLFFLNFYRQVQSAGMGVITVVEYRGEIIGGMVCAFSGRHTLHEWYVASNLNAHKRLYPGVLSTWAGIDYAARSGFSYFDFMGMGSPHQPYGTRDFKKQFGGETINLGRWRLINNSFVYNIGVLGYRLLKSLK